MKTKNLNRLGIRPMVICLVLGIGVFLTSCSREHPDAELTPIGGDIELRFSSFANDKSSESMVHRVRVVIFGSFRSLDRGKLIYNKLATAGSDGSIDRVLISAGLRDIYLIVNEPVGSKVQYDAIQSLDALRALSLPYAGGTTTAAFLRDGLPMYHCYLDQMVTGDSNPFGTGIEYLPAKVTLNLKVKHANFTINQHPVIKDVSIKNLPSSSYFIAQHYTGALITSETQLPTPITNVSGYNYSSSNTFYVPEYIFNNPNNGAYLEITGYINDAPLRVSKWKILLGDAMDAAQKYGSRYDITRNRHYIFTGDAKTYGEMDALDVEVKVMPWDMVPMDNEVGRFVVFKQVTDGKNNVIADGGIDELGTTLTVTCNTNIGGWYTVTRNSKGVVMDTSTPTLPVTAAADQTVTIHSFQLPGV